MRSLVTIVYLSIILVGCDFLSTSSPEGKVLHWGKELQEVDFLYQIQYEKGNRSWREGALSKIDCFSQFSVAFYEGTHQMLVPWPRRGKWQASSLTTTDSTIEVSTNLFAIPDNGFYNGETVRQEMHLSSDSQEEIHYLTHMLTNTIENETCDAP